MPAESRPLVLDNRHTGERLELRRVTEAGETRLELHGSLPPRREGPPLHVHHREHEEGRVVAGTLSAVCDGTPLRIQAGGSVRFPAGSAHRWWNADDTELVFEGTCRPLVDLDRYLWAVFEVVNSGTAQRPPLFYMAHVNWRHRHTQAVLIGPRGLQTVLFVVIVALGTVLGRYRGTTWPGCPARCPVDPQR